MTKEEKKKTDNIKKDIEVLEELYTYENSDEYSYREIRRALRNGIEALNKQIPVKITTQPNLCPTCKKWLVSTGDMYCSCGQKIDWFDKCKDYHTF